MTPDPRAGVALAAGAFAAQVGDDLVLLDLPGGRYLCLSGVSLGGGRRVLGPQEFLAELVDAGLAGGAPGSGLSTRTPEVPARSVAPAAGVPHGAAWALAALGHAATGYWRRPLARLVDDAARGRHAGCPAATPRTLELAARFTALAPFLPLSAKCLLRSFLLLRRLRAEGQDALWVFGVRTWPFAAHCWLQAEDVVLDDDWERVAGYVPILTV